ncbi:MAG: hypothetical protein JO025_27805 [Verrucomicrobia bacterium]|nr:hypothetical protein [Verrucomicrobiota bacterium]
MPQLGFKLRFRFPFLVHVSVIFLLALTLFADPNPAASDNRSISPDKKWTYQPDADPPEIRKTGSDEVGVSFSDECGGGGCDSATIVWAPDSRRFAYGYGHGRDHSTSLYQLDGNEWRPLKSLRDSNEILEAVERVLATQGAKKGLKRDRLQLSEYYERVHNWIDSNTATVYVCDFERAEPEDQFFLVRLVFTLKFDQVGNWEIIRKRPMSDQEFDRFQKQNFER